MLPDSQLPLAAEITEWLLTVPEPDDISYYVENLPFGEVQYLPDIENYCLGRLSENKILAWEQAHGGEVITILPEDEQLNFLRLLAQYSFSSVVKRYAKMYPQLLSLTIDATFLTQWAPTYCAQWFSLTYFAVCKEYDQQRILLSSLQKSTTKIEEITQYQNLVREESRAEALRYEQGQDTTVTEQHAFVEKFQQFSFLPLNLLTELSLPENSQKKQEFLNRLLNVLIVLGQIFASSQTDSEEWELVLLEQLRSAVEDDFLLQLETTRLERLGETKEYRDLVGVLLKVMSSIWSREAVETNKVRDQIQRYILKQTTSATRAQFIRHLYAYMRQSTGVYLDSISPEYILVRVQRMVNEVDLLGFINEVKDLIEDARQKVMVENVIRTFYFITHTYPEPE